MSLRVEYHELVDLDLLNAWNWYEDQEEGLGDRFLGAIHTTVVRASRWPSAGRPVLRDDNDEITERKVPANDANRLAKLVEELARYAGHPRRPERLDPLADDRDEHLDSGPGLEEDRFFGRGMKKRRRAFNPSVCGGSRLPRR